VLSARAIYNEIRDDDRTYRLFLSIASTGETQGGWENERIAALTQDEDFAAKILRHGEDETKHGRLFHSLLKKRNLELMDVPTELNYTLLLENQGIGLSHERLREERPLADEELIRYLVHSRVTEQRAAEEVDQQKEMFGEDPDLGRAIRMIADDEVNHLSFTHEELKRFCDLGHERLVRSMLAEYAKVEIRTYREVSLRVMRAMGDCLGWSVLKRRVLALGVHAIYLFERLWGWRRMTTILPPERPNAMAPRPSDHSPATA